MVARAVEAATGAIGAGTSAGRAAVAPVTIAGSYGDNCSGSAVNHGSDNGGGSDNGRSGSGGGNSGT